MLQAKYPSITLDLEKKIREGYYVNRIPSIEALAEDYNVAKITICKALKPLVKRKLLISSSSRGTLINKRRCVVKTRHICIASSESVETLERNDNITKLVKKIEEDSNVSSLLNVPRRSFHLEVEKLFTEKYDGILFINSSLNYEIVQFLRKEKLPFVSCNMMPACSGIDFVEFDFMAAIRELTDILVKYRYKKVALFFPGRLEGFNDLIISEWLQIKKRLNLPQLESDFFTYDWRLSTNQIWQEFYEFSLGQDILADVLIFWCPLKENLPDEYLIISKEGVASKEVQENILLLKNSPMLPLFLNGYQLLLEKIVAPSNRISKRLLPWAIRFKDISHELKLFKYSKQFNGKHS